MCNTVPFTVFPPKNRNHCKIVPIRELSRLLSVPISEAPCIGVVDHKGVLLSWKKWKMIRMYCRTKTCTRILFTIPQWIVTHHTVHCDIYHKPLPGSSTWARRGGPVRENKAVKGSFSEKRQIRVLTSNCASVRFRIFYNFTILIRSHWTVSNKSPMRTATFY